MAAIDFGSLIDKLDDESDRAALADREQQRTLFLKYVVRTGNFPDKRAQLLKEYEAGASLTGPKGLRRMLGAFDLEYFGRPTWAITSQHRLRPFTRIWTISGFRAS